MKPFHVKNREYIMRIISLIIAILLWSYVMSEVDPVISRTFYNIPVKFLNASSLKERDLVLISSDEESIEVVVKGKRKAVNEMTPEDITASIDLSDASYGSKSTEIIVRLADTNNLVKEKSPSNITLEVDRFVEKDFPLSIQTTGDFLEGYILDATKASQDRVRIKGPKGLMDTVFSVSANVNIDNRKESTLLNSRIQAYDKDGQEIEGLVYEPKTVDVEIGISKTKEVPIEVDLQGDQPEGFLSERVEVTPNNVLLSGPASGIDKVEKIQTGPINIGQLFELQTIPTNLIVPEGVKLVNATENFIVRYNTDSSIKKELKVPLDQVHDIDGNLIDTNLIEETSDIIIRVKGERGLVEALNIKDFKLVAEKQNKSYVIDVEAPNGVEVLSIEPQKIKIK